MIDKIALLHIHQGKVLSSRSLGKNVYYFPGGKRETGESDLDTLQREIAEELATTVISPRYFNTYQAQADGHPDGVQVRMSCWTGCPATPPVPAAEIAEVVWLDGDEPNLVSPVDRLIMADLRVKNFLQPGNRGPRRAILFDLDDTLLQTREVKWAHHRYVAREVYGFDLDDESLARHWGEPFDQMIGNLYRHSGTTDEMRAANRASSHLFPKTAMPGAVTAIQGLLGKGFVVGVVTSTNTDAAVEDLARCGFPVERLAVVQGADQTDFHKPDPRVFTPVVEQFRALGVRDITYVGDAVIDAHAASGACLRFVAATTGLFPAHAFSDVPSVASLSELWTVL